MAAAFRVDSKTVIRWADTGYPSSLRTTSGHRRFSTAEVRALLTAAARSPQQAPIPGDQHATAPARHPARPRRTR
jgi:hypothetical protein